MLWCLARSPLLLPPYRHQAFTTNTPRGQLAFLEAPHRAHARVEDRRRTGKDTGIGHLPSRHTHINIWVELVLVTADPLALAQSMLLTDQPELRRAEPKTLRSRLLHVVARITHGQRKVLLRLAEHWPCPCAWLSTGPGPSPWPRRSPACGRYPPGLTVSTTDEHQDVASVGHRVAARQRVVIAVGPSGVRLPG